MNVDLFTKQLEIIVNKAIALDPESSSKLAEFEGKVLCIEASGIDKKIYILPREGHLDVSIDIETTPDTTIRGTLMALFKLGLRSDAAPLLLTGEVEFDGDVRLGRRFKKFLSQLDIDWEEQLSRVVGDVPANIATKLKKRFSSWIEGATSSIADDMSEYLQEESRDIVSGPEIDIFLKGVDKLRDDVDRLDATVKRLTSA